MFLPSASVALLALFASGATPARLPDTHPGDGVYMVTYNSTGHEVHVRISDSQGSGVAGRRTIPRTSRVETRRPALTFITHCGCGLHMDHADTDAAVQALKNQCLAGHPTCQECYCDIKNTWYSIHKSVVAFQCYRGSPYRQSAAGMKYDFAYITYECGLYVPGTQSTDSRIGDIGYMNYSPGLDFCARARDSGRRSCPGEPGWGESK